MKVNTQIAELKTQSRAFSTGILNPANMTEALQMAETISKSSLVPKDYQGNPGNVLVAIQWGMEVGLGPLQAMQNIAVINGRPTLWGDALLALCKANPVCEYITEDCDGQTAICTAKRRGDPSPVVREFSIEEAKRAGLLGKAGPWTQYPKRMLQMRARGYCLRDAFPDVLKGMAVAEEEQDKPREVMGSVETSGPAPRPASRTAELKAKINESLIKAGAMPAIIPEEAIDNETGEIQPPNEFPTILNAFAAAPNRTSLKSLKPRVLELQEPWQAEAKKAYNERLAELELAATQPTQE